MKILLIALLPAAQEESVESLVRKLAAARVEDRDQAEAELRRRGEEAVQALERSAQGAADPAERERARRLLREIVGGEILSLDLVHARKVSWKTAACRIDAAMAELSRIAGIPIRVDSERGFEPQIKSAEFADRPLDEILDSLARQIDGFWILEPRRLILAAPGQRSLRLFDVRDLTWSMWDEPAVPLDPGRRAEGADEEHAAELTGEDLCNLIMAAIGRDRWKEEEGRALQFVNGLILARNDSDVLQAAGVCLDDFRKKLLADIRVEIWACAVRAGDGIAEGPPGLLIEAAREGKAARLVAAFDRVVRDKRRMALESVKRTLIVTGYDAKEGFPLTSQLTTGAQANVRASLSEERKRARVDLEARFSRLLSMEKKKTERGEVHVPLCAGGTIHVTTTIKTGEPRVLGRLGDKKIVDGMDEIILVGRITPVERK